MLRIGDRTGDLPALLLLVIDVAAELGMGVDPDGGMGDWQAERVGECGFEDRLGDRPGDEKMPPADGGAEIRVLYGEGNSEKRPGEEL